MVFNGLIREEKLQQSVVFTGVFHGWRFSIMGVDHSGFIRSFDCRVCNLAFEMD